MRKNRQQVKITRIYEPGIRTGNIYKDMQDTDRDKKIEVRINIAGKRIRTRKSEWERNQGKCITSVRQACQYALKYLDKKKHMMHYTIEI